MDNQLIAHVKKNDDETWAVPHLLSDHLIGTAQLAAAFAAKFNSGEWGKAAGLAHDVGKGRVVWQNYIQKKSGFGFDEEAHLEGKAEKIPHAIHGAKLVEELFGKSIGRLIAYCIAGHHSGLQDWSAAEGAGQSSLQFQQTQVKDVQAINPSVVSMLHSAKPTFPPWKFEKGLGKH